jgi:hypothetical protein
VPFEDRDAGWWHHLPAERPSGARYSSIVLTAGTYTSALTDLLTYAAEATA